ncbi:MAG: hypothetical protein A3F73_14340 [Gallionellales bacterium RIFCSPLOWO2_12_FULL_59_22]|nr:MAG: hypothetical protein A3H99_06975 [Gallionellales bacterium RIFCSPLOWO2_02_FULL_59_110]OGT05598.1 MAG: hypothetical protein A2Z65_04185 [Gallionellales bacterium RIFCSPLOWO2_02_58_13]OGT14733.1 MAG: hypothetical protein A3F73_14340 [Gallionellales bacterium RIFCSPLOWO2_12_FULL_59_22]
MISCLLIRVSRNQQGLPVLKESALAGESLQIGRGAACKIHLPDHRVGLLHATVRRSEDGALYIEGENGATIKINGAAEQSAALSPGLRIEVGPYLLVVEPVPDGRDIALSVEMAHSLQEKAATCRTVPVTLAELGLSKRKLGFSLASGILFLFLLLPLLASTSTTFDKWQATLPVILTELWNPGPLTGGHSVFGAKCTTCHQQAFRAISDDICAECHKQVAKRLREDDLHARIFKDVRCTDCHQDHRGKAGLVLHDSLKCVACHGDIKGKYARTEFDDVRDFATDHPPFNITFPDGKNVVHVRQDDKGKLVEKPGLKLNHQVHLDKKGLLSPKGNTVLACRDCHRLEESGAHFAPMTMRKTCQQSQCHVQYFIEPVEEVVPHGSEREVLNRLRELNARWLAGSAENMAACKPESGAGMAASHTLGCVDDLARKYAATFFKENLECGQCHEIEPSGNNDVPWKVTPLHINRDYHPVAVFAHSRHDTVDCTDCHDKANSKPSAEIAMPAIEKCRECHAGNRSVKGKIKSTCDSCHRFHRAAE